MEAGTVAAGNGKWWATERSSLGKGKVRLHWIRYEPLTEIWDSERPNCGSSIFLRESNRPSSIAAGGSFVIVGVDHAGVVGGWGSWRKTPVLCEVCNKNKGDVLFLVHPENCNEPIHSSVEEGLEFLYDGLECDYRTYVIRNRG